MKEKRTKVVNEHRLDLLQEHIVLFLTFLSRSDTSSLFTLKEASKHLLKNYFVSNSFPLPNISPFSPVAR